MDSRHTSRHTGHTWHMAHTTPINNRYKLALHGISKGNMQTKEASMPNICQRVNDACNGLVHSNDDGRPHREFHGPMAQLRMQSFLLVAWTHKTLHASMQNLRETSMLRTWRTQRQSPIYTSLLVAVSQKGTYNNKFQNTSCLDAKLMSAGQWCMQRLCA